MRHATRILILLVFALSTACAIKPAPPDGEGNYPKGHARFETTDPATGRTLTVEVFYPGDGKADTSDPIADSFLTEEQAAIWNPLLEASTPGCVNDEVTSVPNAGVSRGGPFPVIVFSHCLNCTRFSSFTVAQRLASHGFIVVAPDHTGNTFFDSHGSGSTGLSSDVLEDRLADVTHVLDLALGDAAPFPEQLWGQVDATKVGSLGHSFGSVTAGYLAQEDDRVKAAFGLAAPMENPLLPAVQVADIVMPLGLILAVEDNSIGAIGNDFIYNNYDEANSPVWLWEFADAGHLSVSDLCGIDDGFMAGCGEDTRQTNPDETFTYLDPDTGRHMTATTVTAFFQRYLDHDPEGYAATWMDGDPMPGVTVQHR